MIVADRREHDRSSEILVGYLRIAARRKFAITAPTILCAAAAWIIASAAPPRYVADAVIALDARKVQVIDIGSVVSRLPEENAALRTELDAIASRSMAALVADRLDFRNRPDLLAAMEPPPSIYARGREWVRSAVHRLANWTGLAGSTQVGELLEVVRPSWSAGRTALRQAVGLDAAAATARRSGAATAGPAIPSEGDIIDWLLGGLRVSNDGRSFTIYVSFGSVHPAVSAEIANAFVATYLQETVGMKVRAARSASNWLRSRLEELRNELEASETAVLRFVREAGLMEFRGDTIASQQISDLNAQLSLIRTERARIEAKIQTARAAAEGDLPGDNLPEVASSPFVQTLRRNLGDVEVKLADLYDRGSFRHPDTLALEAQRAALKQQLAVAMKRAISSLETEAAAVRRHEREIEESLKAMAARYGKAGEATIRLNQLKREAEANRAIYESFLGRYKEMIEQEGLATSEARLLSLAEPPQQPSGSGRLPILALGLMGGLMLGGISAALRERLDQKLHEVADVEELSRSPVVGLLPTVPPWRAAPELLVLRRRQAPFSQAIRRMHVTLRLPRDPGRARVIMITSAIAGEGKTSFCAALARSLALSELRVLVVDADLHRPRLAKALGLRPQTDTQDVVRGRSSLSEAVRIDELSGAHVLTAMAEEEGRHLVLHGAGWQALIEAARARYDVVIVDTPPVISAPDAAAVGMSADASLFLVRWNGPTRTAITASLRFLNLCGVRIDGIVVTRAKTRLRPSYADPYEPAFGNTAVVNAPRSLQGPA